MTSSRDVDYSALPDLLERHLNEGVSGTTVPHTWNFAPKTVTHRAYHDRQRWRERLAGWLYRLSNRIDRLADRVEPWHEDDEWYSSPPVEHFTVTFRNGL